MAVYATILGNEHYAFSDLKHVLAVASHRRSGDDLAGLSAQSDAERVAARYVLADLPLKLFLNEVVVPYEEDEVTRLIIDSHDKIAFAPVAHLTVGELRDWLLAADAKALSAVSRGLTPEMVAAVSKLMRNQDLISVARKCRVTTAFRNTLGLQAGWVRVCSPTIRPTMSVASQPPFWTGFSLVSAMPSSASIRRPTIFRTQSR